MKKIRCVPLPATPCGEPSVKKYLPAARVTA